MFLTQPRVSDFIDFLRSQICQIFFDQSHWKCIRFSICLSKLFDQNHCKLIMFSHSKVYQINIENALDSHTAMSVKVIWSVKKMYRHSQYWVLVDYFSQVCTVDQSHWKWIYTRSHVCQNDLIRVTENWLVFQAVRSHKIIESESLKIYRALLTQSNSSEFTYFL